MMVSYMYINGGEMGRKERRWKEREREREYGNETGTLLNCSP